MQEDIDNQTRCSAIVAALNEKRDWKLSAGRQDAYVKALLPLLPQDASDPLIEKGFERYHQDHERVRALSDPDDPLHDETWRLWSTQAIAILHGKGLSRSQNGATDTEDLAQVGLAALARALPSFRYGSSFSTWAYSVVVRSARRHIRDQQAHKRTGKVISLEQNSEVEIQQSAAMLPEELAQTQALGAEVQSVLIERGGERMARIFHLWFVENLRPEEIGVLVKLSPSRVRVLLIQARKLLQEDPGLRSWFGEDPQEPK